VTAGKDRAETYSMALERIDAGVSCALITVLAVQGSAPQAPGACMLADDHGDTWGTVGGGLVEAEALDHARHACRSGKAHFFEHLMYHDYARDADAICGGRMVLLVTPLNTAHRAPLAHACHALQHRESGVLLTTFNPGDAPAPSMAWCEQDAPHGGPHGIDAATVKTCLESGVPKLLDPDPTPSGTPRKVFLDPFTPSPVLLIAGAGHVGQALAHAADAAGFDVAVLDDRAEYLRPGLFPPGTRLLQGDVVDQLRAFPLDHHAYVVLVTRGHRHDAEALEACIHRPAAYIGMIGSRRKIALIRKDFIENELATAAQFDRVYAPIGLDIGAVTVPEIAVSIVAQLIAVRRRGEAPRLHPPRCPA